MFPVTSEHYQSFKISDFHGGDYEEWHLGILRHVALARTDVSDFVFLRSVRRLLVAANVLPSSPILATLMMEALSPSETSVLTRATRHNIQEDVIPHYPSFFLNKAQDDG
jgi:hypothetical protein